ncbi:hypothetical protein GSI_11296 [Ganoderma sinense ZZ0214-1]|uniref:Rho-GAP domain-containing protein n=1 Tax=Ganoderma sinense ZZ0214-1 TaxID=1077348 RepID=A0A2G8RYP0_9APHY|nr:hypothetical protein GSI_11296 [Ganoderma sinense ZZ0214-1]
MPWSALEEEFVSHHPSSPSRVGGFAEQLARGFHNPLVESATMPADHAAGAARLQMATVQRPCLPSLGQQELPLDIPLAREATCASSATACPPSFLAHSSGSELAIFHPSTHPHGAAPPIYRPHAERPTAMSASFVHPKLDALPALDMESDRLARACGQGPSFSGSARSSFSHDDPRAGNWGSRPRTPERRGGDPPAPALRARAREGVGCPPYPPPAALGLAAGASLERDGDGNDALPLGECVDVHGVLERWARAHVRSAVGVEGPQASRPGRRQGQEGAAESTRIRTFGAPVSVAVNCASMSTVLGGFQHPIPWVVYACVEELNRTGIYQPGLFRAVPHRSRLEKLISGFDCALPASRLDPGLDSLCPPCAPTASSTRASLRKESMADVCALLKSYMDSIPEPLLHEDLTNALHRLCVEPSEKRAQEKSASEDNDSTGYFHLPPSISHRASDLVNGATHTHTRRRSNLGSHSPSPSPLSSPFPLSPLLMTPSERRSADLSLENAQVLRAQHLLRLAPPPLCSLFAYLCAFFTQLPLSPDNGITLDDVARMFGRSLAGGPAPKRNAVLVWLLERWPRVADGLFSIAGADADEGEDVGASPGLGFPPFAPPFVPSTDTYTDPTDAADAEQSPDRTPHVPYSVPTPFLSPESEVSGAGAGEARRRGSLVSLDGAESVFTASTAESDDGVHGVRTPFSSEFPTVPLPAVREYEFELGWEEPPSVHPMLNGGVENGLAALSSEAELGSLALDAFVDPKRPAVSTNRTDSLRSTSELTLSLRRIAPHSPPLESESDSPSRSPSSAVHPRSASRASGISDAAKDSPLSILKRLGFRESSPHRSASVRKKNADGGPAAASNGAVEH